MISKYNTTRKAIALFWSASSMKANLFVYVSVRIRDRLVKPIYNSSHFNSNPT